MNAELKQKHKEFSKSYLDSTLYTIGLFGRYSDFKNY